MKPAGYMYRFMSEWTGVGAGAGAARTITITADPLTIITADLVPGLVVADAARGDNNADKLPVSYASLPQAIKTFLQSTT